MPYYADLSSDLPAPYKQKRAVFYRQGLKVYGLLPYILARRLKAQFFSGETSWGNVRISAGSFESNWTAIPYQQSPEAVNALLDWLYADKGFEVAIASEQDWDDTIFSANVYRMPPHTWYPAAGGAREGYLQVLGSPASRAAIVALLGPVQQGE
jgi:hypothetical protein